MTTLTFARQPAQGGVLHNSVGNDGALIFSVQVTTYDQAGRNVTLCCLTGCTSSRFDVTPTSARAIAAELVAAADAADAMAARAAA